MLKQHKNERISTKVTAPIYHLLKKAADIKGSTINRFLIQAAVEKAETVIEQDKTIRLTLRDAEVFYGAIDNPPPPDEKLIDAIRKYRESFPDAENRKSD